MIWLSCSAATSHKGVLLDHSRFERMVIVSSCFAKEQSGSVAPAVIRYDILETASWSKLVSLRSVGAAF